MLRQLTRDGAVGWRIVKQPQLVQLLADGQKRSVRERDERRQQVCGEPQAGSLEWGPVEALGAQVSASVS